MEYTKHVSASEDGNGTAPAAKPIRYVWPVLALTIALAYCLATLVHPPASWPAAIIDAAAALKILLQKTITASLSTVGWTTPAKELVDGLYLIVVGIVLPWLTMAALRHGRPRDLGVRVPNRIGWRVLIVAYAVSIPFLVWMARSPDIAGYYLPHLRRAGAFAFLTYYGVNMLGEHFLLHGVMLAALRPGLRWPDKPPIEGGGLTRGVRFLRWIGLAQPTGDLRGSVGVRAWLGLQPACVFAILGSALLFGLVHVGKDPRELALSLPGGAALAFLAYRTNSFLTPFILHIATAATACAMFLAFEV